MTNKSRFFYTCSVIFLVMLMVPCAFAEKAAADAFSEFPEALGFFYGDIAGAGLNYHRWEGKMGYQVTAGAIYLPPGLDNYSNMLLDYVIGFENQFVVYSEDFTDWLSGLLSLFWGVNHRGYIPITEDYDEESEEYSYTVGSYTPTFTLGGGIGIEVLVFKHFSIPFEFGYGATYLPLASTVVDMFEINLLFQAGFRYRY